MFERLVDAVREQAEAELGPRLARCEDETDKAVLERIVLLTVQSMGMHVSRDGEVCDPRPTPAPHMPQQQDVRWSGGRRSR
jgi:hypothetical protein